MKKFKLIGTIILIVGFFTGLALFLIGYFKTGRAGIRVEAAPGAVLFIDGIEVGRTPYDEVRSSGEITIKLVPETSNTPLAPYETRVSLQSGIKTVVRVEFGEDEDKLASDIVSFEKIGESDAQLVVVSVPDASEISVDGNPKGFTPHKTSTLLPGEHKITISSSGYLDRSINVRLVRGYKLTLAVKLSKDSTVATSPTPTPAPEIKESYVEILSTPTGFLRVRKEPSTTTEIVGQVKPGQKFALLDEDTKTGWFKIEFEKSKEGWVSDEFAKKVEGALPAPTPTASPKPSPAKTP